MIDVLKRGLVMAGMLLLVGTAGLVGAPTASAAGGGDIAAGLSGPRTVRLGDDITYTITGTNVGDRTATGVQLSGMVPDWFNWRAADCLSGTVDPNDRGTCDFGDVAPGATVSMTLTLEACCPEKHMFEIGWAYATNDVNPDNDSATMKLNFRGPKH